MIKKLMKHDINKMIKRLLIIYFIALVFAGITRLINIGKDIKLLEIIGYVFSGITYSALASILVNTIVHILLVFNSNFYKDESYLTHTLPISRSKLLLSKYLSGLIVIISSVIVCFLSLFILFFSPEFVEVLKFLIATSMDGFNMPIVVFVLLIVMIIFFQVCSMVSMAFTAIVKGNTYNSKKVGKCWLWFLVYYMISLFSTLLIIVITFAITGNIKELTSNTLSQSSFLIIVIVALILYALYTVIYYLLCNKLFNKGVNVD